MGKTSIAHEMARQLLDDRSVKKAVFVDLDDCVDEVHMIVMIAEQVAALDRQNPTLTQWAKRLWDTFPGFSEISVSEFTLKLQESMSFPICFCESMLRVGAIE